MADICKALSWLRCYLVLPYAFPVKNSKSLLMVLTRMADDADLGRGGGCRGAFLAPLFLDI